MRRGFLLPWHSGRYRVEEKLPRTFAVSRTAASAITTSPAVGCPPLLASLELCPACQGEGWAGVGRCYCQVGTQLAAEDRAWRIQFTWQQAAIPAELTGRRIETWPGATAVRDYLLKWVERWQGKQGPSLVLTGKARSGKTGLVLGLAYRLVEKTVSEGVPSFTMRFVTAYDLMAALTTWRGREERFKSYLDCDLLILDDLGREPAWDSNVANLTWAAWR